MKKMKDWKKENVRKSVCVGGGKQKMWERRKLEKKRGWAKKLKLWHQSAVDDFLISGIQALQHQWKCVDCKGDYVEK